MQGVRQKEYGVGMLQIDYRTAVPGDGLRNPTLERILVPEI